MKVTLEITTGSIPMRVFAGEIKCVADLSKMARALDAHAKAIKKHLPALYRAKVLKFRIITG